MTWVVYLAVGVIVCAFVVLIALALYVGRHDPA